MRSRDWLMLSMLACPISATAQTVERADVIGGWAAEVTHADSKGKSLGPRAWLVLWPDGLWWYGGALMAHKHGGARWRLVGDTLWLANDYLPYFHPMIETRIEAIQRKGYGLAVMDREVINQRPPYPVADSIYWSQAFRDTTSACYGRNSKPCGTWVYKVSKNDDQLHLIRLDSLSRGTWSVATSAVLTRDSLTRCNWIYGCN